MADANTIINGFTAQELAEAVSLSDPQILKNTISDMDYELNKPGIDRLALFLSEGFNPVPEARKTVNLMYPVNDPWNDMGRKALDVVTLENESGEQRTVVLADNDRHSFRVLPKGLRYYEKYDTMIEKRTDDIIGHLQFMGKPVNPENTVPGFRKDMMEYMQYLVYAHHDKPDNMTIGEAIDLMARAMLQAAYEHPFKDTYDVGHELFECGQGRRDEVLRMATHDIEGLDDHDLVDMSIAYDNLCGFKVGRPAAYMETVVDIVTSLAASYVVTACPDLASLKNFEKEMSKMQATTENRKKGLAWVDRYSDFTGYALFAHAFGLAVKEGTARDVQELFTDKKGPISMFTAEMLYQSGRKALSMNKGVDSITLFGSIGSMPEALRDTRRVLDNNFNLTKKERNDILRTYCDYRVAGEPLKERGEETLWQASLNELTESFSAVNEKFNDRPEILAKEAALCERLEAMKSDGTLNYASLVQAVNLSDMTRENPAYISDTDPRFRNNDNGLSLRSSIFLPGMDFPVIDTPLKNLESIVNEINAAPEMFRAPEEAKALAMAYGTNLFPDLSLTDNSSGPALQVSQMSVHAEYHGALVCNPVGEPATIPLSQDEYDTISAKTQEEHIFTKEGLLEFAEISPECAAPFRAFAAVLDEMGISECTCHIDEEVHEKGSYNYRYAQEDLIERNTVLKCGSDTKLTVNFDTTYGREQRVSAEIGEGHYDRELASAVRSMLENNGCKMERYSLIDAPEMDAVEMEAIGEDDPDGRD